MKGACIGRGREKTDRTRGFRVVHVDHGEPFAEHMADIGMALMHHDLHAIAVAIEQRAEAVEPFALDADAPGARRQ